MENERLHKEGKQELANTKDDFNKINGEYNALAAKFRELEVKYKHNDEPEFLKQQLIDQTERNEAHVKSLIADQEIRKAKYVGLEEKGITRETNFILKAKYVGLEGKGMTRETINLVHLNLNVSKKQGRTTKQWTIKMMKRCPWSTIS